MGKVVPRVEKRGQGRERERRRGNVKVNITLFVTLGYNNDIFLIVFVVLYLPVDDQLDEDDLELIKENIGFDIQAVSLGSFYP